MANPSASSRPRSVNADVLSEDSSDIARANTLRIVVAHALKNAGDQVVKASTVLTWLLTSLGAPLWTIGLLVPIRESGSMLPQAAMRPWARRQRQRK